MRIVTETDLDGAGNVVAVRAYTVGTTPVPPAPPPSVPLPPVPPPPPTPPQPPANVIEGEVAVMPWARYVYAASADYVLAIPFDVPEPASLPANFSGTGSEYQWGGTALWQAALSRTPGDMTGAMGGSSVIEVSRDFAPGDAGRWYYNCRLDPGHADRGTSFSWRPPR